MREAIQLPHDARVGTIIADQINVRVEIERPTESRQGVAIPIDCLFAKTLFTKPEQRPAMLANDASRVIDQLHGSLWKQFLLKFGGPCDLLEARKEFRFHSRSKMSEQIRSANACELFAQTRGLQIEFRKLRAFPPAPVQ